MVMSNPGLTTAIASRLRNCCEQPVTPQSCSCCRCTGCLCANMSKKGHQLLGGGKMEGAHKEHRGDVKRKIMGKMAQCVLMEGGVPCQKRYEGPHTLRGQWLWQHMPGQGHPWGAAALGQPPQRWRTPFRGCSICRNPCQSRGKQIRSKQRQQGTVMHVIPSSCAACHILKGIREGLGETCSKNKSSWDYKDVGEEDWPAILPSNKRRTSKDSKECKGSRKNKSDIEQLH